MRTCIVHDGNNYGEYDYSISLFHTRDQHYRILHCDFHSSKGKLSREYFNVFSQELISSIFYFCDGIKKTFEKSLQKYDFYVYDKTINNYNFKIIIRVFCLFVK